MNTSATLYALDDDSRHIAFGQFLLHALYIVEVKESNLMASVEWRLYLRIIGHCYCSACASVETAAEGNDATLACMERCQFERILIALCARVIEKKTIVLVSAQLTQTLC